MTDFREMRQAANLRVVGISEMCVSTSPEDILVTYSLGSCVGLTLYDPVAAVGGLVHCMLPLSRMDPVRAEHSPCVFVDTGVSALLQTLFDLGARRRRMIAKAAGGSEVLDLKQVFRIGERNHVVLRRILWKNNILLEAEQFGGNDTRTLHLYMATGETTIKIGSDEMSLVGRRNGNGFQRSAGG